MSKKILCVISARGGSKGLKNKNFKDFCGKPLIAWSILQAKNSKYIQDVFISTDSDKISKVSKKYGAKVQFLRSKKLSKSYISKFLVWKNALEILEKKNKIKNDYFLDLDCTNPLRDSSDIDKFIRSFVRKKQLDGLITICNSRKNPYFNMIEKNNKGYLEISKKSKNQPTSRQLSPKVYDQVASMYIFKANYIKRVKKLYDGKIDGYLLNEHQNFDIDNALDYIIIQQLFKKFYIKKKSLT